MGSKVIVFLAFFFLAMVLLISSNQVGARDLADTSNEKANGADVNANLYGSGYGRYGPNPIRGGGGHGGGFYRGGGGNGGGNGHGGGGSYCRHGYCHYRCCAYAGEKVDAVKP